MAQQRRPNGPEQLLKLRSKILLQILPIEQEESCSLTPLSANSELAAGESAGRQFPRRNAYQAHPWILPPGSIEVTVVTTTLPLPISIRVIKRSTRLPYLLPPVVEVRKVVGRNPNCFVVLKSS